MYKEKKNKVKVRRFSQLPVINPTRIEGATLTDEEIGKLLKSVKITRQINFQAISQLIYSFSSRKNASPSDIHRL